LFLLFSYFLPLTLLPLHILPLVGIAGYHVRGQAISADILEGEKGEKEEDKKK
jgi:hypothetical protein